MRWVILIIGLSAGLFAALLFSATRNQNAGDPEARAANIVQVIAVSADVAAGKRLVAEDLVWVEWPQEAVHPEFFTIDKDAAMKESLVGSVIRSSLGAGMPVMKSQIADAASGYLSSILTPGMRAVALPISAAQTAGGFILPEDRVDVMIAHACNDPANCVEGGKVETLLENVRVLAIDQAGDVENNGTAIVGETATLELTPDDARKLISALTIGTPTLVLRAVGDDSTASPPLAQAPAEAETDAEAKSDASEDAEAAPPPITIPRGPNRTVRVIRNGEAQSYGVN